MDEYSHEVDACSDEERCSLDVLLEKEVMDAQLGLEEPVDNTCLVLILHTHKRASSYDSLGENIL